ncbi:MAG: hypothetical protein HC927_00295 [Deltaproteobacteria bacterium]|nr:hypothetical protein [Deltaproteobacteria bacterium]
MSARELILAALAVSVASCAGDETPKDDAPEHDRCDGPPGRVVDIDSGRSHTCVVFEGGQLECWGGNYHGQLGYGDLVAQLELIGDDETPADVGFVDVGGCVDEVSVHRATTCAILRDGGVKCWGYNDFGVLGLGHTETMGDDETPASIEALRFPADVVEVVGDETICALLENGEIYCWGYDVCGNLGHGSAGSPPEDQRADQGDPVQQKSKARAIADGDFSRCLIDDDRELTCWGSKWPDNGHTEHYTCPAPPSKATPHHVEGPVLDVAVGTDHACALDATHHLYCWGDNDFGELGYAHDEYMTFPGIPAVETGGEVIAIEAGRRTSCAVYVDGRARCWGMGYEGQLGQANIEHIGDDETPADVPFIDIGEPIQKLALGDDFVCALTVSGQVRCWGHNEYGQLGLGHTENIGDDEVPASVAPVQLLQ